MDEQGAQQSNGDLDNASAVTPILTNFISLNEYQELAGEFQGSECSACPWVGA